MVFLMVLLPVPLLANEGGEAVVVVSPWMIIPFVTLLLAIALMPFINRHWWEHHYPAVAIGLGLVTVVYYLVVLHAPARLLHTLVEYISFIVLIGSLFVVAGGIHIRIRGKSRPLSNVFLLAIGAVLSNIVGNHGRIHDSDPPVHPREQVPDQTVPCRLLHLYREQHGGSADTHR